MFVYGTLVTLAVTRGSWFVKPSPAAALAAR
jgi:hypothetical protein